MSGQIQQHPMSGQMLQQQPQQQVIYMQAPVQQQQPQIIYMQAPVNGQAPVQQSPMYGNMPQAAEVNYQIPTDTSQPAILSGEGVDGGINHPTVGINTTGANIYEGAITNEQREYETNPPAKHWKCGIFTLAIYTFLFFEMFCAAVAVSAGWCKYKDAFGDLCGEDRTTESSYGSEYDCELRCDFPCNCASGGLIGSLWWILFGGLYLFYLCESCCPCCSSTRKYVGNIINLDAMKGYISSMVNTAPVINWNIECYHYRTTRTKNGTRRTKVVTHRANAIYQYRAWRDVSPIIEGLENHGLIKMQFDKTFVFANQQTSVDYESRKNEFIWANKRDVHQNFWMTLDVHKFEGRMLCEGYPGAVGSMISTNMYNFFTFITFSWCYRKWLDGKCARKAHTWVKEISV